MDLAKYLIDLGFAPISRPSLQDLKKRWKDLCRKHHPDRGGNEAEFRRVTHAYNMLTDPEYRNRETLHEMRTRKPNAKGDLNIRVQVPISFEDGFFGRKIVVSWNRLELAEDLRPRTDRELQDLHTETVDIPPGSVHGFEHLVPGGGHKLGEEYGAAYIVFAAMPHKTFRVENYDVVGEERIPLAVLLKGGRLEVQTMYGVKAVNIPPGTAPGDRLTILGAGVARRGSHIVEVTVAYPTKQELKTGEWAGLGIDWGETPAEPDKEADDLLKLAKTLMQSMQRNMDEDLLKHMSMEGTPYDAGSHD